MPRDWNINISVGGGNRRGAFNGGNVFRTRQTLDSAMYRRQQNGSNIGKFNLKKVVNLGLAFNTFQKGNEIVGAHTEDRLRQRKVDVGMRYAKYAIGISIKPVTGGIYAISDMAYRAIMYSVELQKKNREANYYKRLSGNNSFSGSRYRGDYS